MRWSSVSKIRLFLCCYCKLAFKFACDLCYCGKYFSRRHAQIVEHVDFFFIRMCRLWKRVGKPVNVENRTHLQKINSATSPYDRALERFRVLCFGNYSLETILWLARFREIVLQFHHYIPLILAISDLSSIRVSFRMSQNLCRYMDREVYTRRHLLINCR